MKKKPFQIVLVLIVTIAYLISKTPRTYTVESYNGQLIKKIVTVDNKNTMALVNSGEQLELIHNQNIYKLETLIPFTKNTSIHFLNYPSIDFVYSTNDPLDFMYSYSLKENGKEEARYFMTFFSINNQKLVKKWSSDFRTEITLKYNQVDMLTLIFPELNNKIVINLNKKTKFKHFIEFNNSTFDEGKIILMEPTFLKIMDYTNDGFKNIILFTPIYYTQTNTYLTTLCTVWEIKDDNVNIINNFCMQEDEAEGKVLKIIADYKHIYRNELIQKLSNFSINDNESSSIIKELLNKEIIDQNNELYYIKFKE